MFRALECFVKVPAVGIEINNFINMHYIAKVACPAGK